MKRPTILITLLLGIIFLSACDGLRVVRGTGDMGEETREVSGFNAVELDGMGTIYITQGDRESLLIEAEENLMKFLETEVDGQILRISTRDGINVVPTQGIFYYLTVSDLEKIAVNGLGSVDLPDLVTQQLTMEINGGGQINIGNLESERLNAGISGLGDLILDGGQVQQQSISIDGGGNYKAPYLSSDTAAISINGLGSATLRAREKLDVDISGGGSVIYSGKPQVNQTISGLGTVSAVEE